MLIYFCDLCKRPLDINTHFQDATRREVDKRKLTYKKQTYLLCDKCVFHFDKIIEHRILDKINFEIASNGVS